ncbi:MAG: aspartate carbamoyltransferase [Alphaproteobacteria bacterium]|nr:aspartate carbamoyltransferase [Alphaproteobacteria bacterium]MBQ3118031.1 aspartate carbamoyltransferase [Alphaproteobacteria bacterium]
MKHLISCDQIKKEDLLSLLTLTDKIKNNPVFYTETLKNKVIATLFYEPSTRTRLSFSAAAVRLGASLINTENANENSSATKGETLEDTIRIVQGYADAIILRHPDDEAAQRAVQVATIPIINAGSGGKEHPSQGLLDLYTINTYKKRLDNLKIAIIGDLKYGRTIHSLLKLLTLFDGIEIHALSVKELELPPLFENLLKKRNAKYTKHTTLNTLPKDVDIIYQTRIQKERLQNEGIQASAASFIIDKKQFDTFSADTYLMHPLPRIEEMNSDIDNDPRAIFFSQAHNGMYVRMAVLYQCLCENK